MFLLSIWIGQLIFFISRTLKLGGGSAAPGYYALKLYPRLVERLSKDVPKSVIITGTNGKTTTSRLLAHFAKARGQKVISNQTGSNMERGVASTLIQHSSIFGRVEADLAVWEVDEAGLKILAPKIKPQIIVFLNAARDQLDRYGELDSLVREWQEALSKIDYSPLILVNADDANTYKLIQKIKNQKSKTFGLDKKLVDWEENTKVKIKPDFMASNIKQQGLESVSFQLTVNGHQLPVKLPLGGIYNVYNFLAALAGAYHLGLPIDLIIKSTSSYKTAFGRIERFHNGYILLIKNPNGTNQTLNTIIPKLTKRDRVMVILNDNIADGTDVSWIWDAQFEQLAHFGGEMTASGTRAEDMALRLKYAGIPEDEINIESDLRKAFKSAQQNLKGRLFILPTYTALLELQRILAKTGAKQHYWKDS